MLYGSVVSYKLPVFDVFFRQNDPDSTVSFTMFHPLAKDALYTVLSYMYILTSGQISKQTMHRYLENFHHLLTMVECSFFVHVNFYGQLQSNFSTISHWN